MYTDLPRSFQHKTTFSRFLSGASVRPSDGVIKHLRPNVEPLRPLMNKLRVKKSEAEVANMRIAGRASGRAFTNAMHNSFTGERILGAFLDYHFKLNGLDGPAYVPVIAGGSVSNVASMG